MPEQDWIIRGDKLVIKKEAQFNMIELYRTLRHGLISTITISMKENMKI